LAFDIYICFGVGDVPMRTRKITQKEFERAFWIGRTINSHLVLCTVFCEIIGAPDIFPIFWKRINVKKFDLASRYLDMPYSSDNWDERAMFRLMIAQEFINQFNNDLEK
jgi:hypothetical protein